MEIINKMLMLIEKEVKAYLLKKTEIIFDTFTFRTDTDIVLIIATHGNIIAEAWYNKHIAELPEMIGMATELNWKYVNEVFVLDSGYVVFEEAIADHFLEQYNVIEDGDYHSPVTFEDGKHPQCSGVVSLGCECADCTWEPNYDEFRFSKTMPE